MVNEVIILAAGEGSGFWPVSKTTPKALIDVMGKPLLHHQLDWLCSQGIDKVIIALQSKHLAAVQFWLERGLSYPVETILSVDKKPPGSAGSVYSALKYVRSDEFLVINCDDITDIDIAALGKLGPPSVCVAPYRLRFGVVETNCDKVTSFGEKPVLPYYTSCGWYLMSKSVNFPERGSFEYDLLPELAEKGILKAYKHKGIWWTVNTWREKAELEKTWWSGTAPKW